MKLCRNKLHEYDETMKSCPECSRAWRLSHLQRIDDLQKAWLSRNPEYRTWRSMHDRCTRKNSKQYMDYGGRGIRVCSRWTGKDGYLNFIKNMGPRPSMKHELDRVNNDHGYSPDNCAWRTDWEQSRNKRNTRMVTYDGKTQCLKDWSVETGIPWATLHYRVITAKWPLQRAFSGVESGYGAD